MRGVYPFVVHRDRPSVPDEDSKGPFLPTSPLQTINATNERLGAVSPRRKSASLEQIGGVGPAHAEILRDRGLRTTDDLLLAGATARQRQELAETANAGEEVVLRWVNQADLFRIKGVGSDYAKLLEAAGVDTVSELAERRADYLSREMAEVNGERGLVRRVPSQAQVAAWIEAAKGLPRVLSY